MMRVVMMTVMIDNCTKWWRKGKDDDKKRGHGTALYSVDMFTNVSSDVIVLLYFSKQNEQFFFFSCPTDDDARKIDDF